MPKSYLAQVVEAQGDQIADLRDMISAIAQAVGVPGLESAENEGGPADPPPLEVPPADPVAPPADAEVPPAEGDQGAEQVAEGDTPPLDLGE